MVQATIGRDVQPPRRRTRKLGRRKACRDCSGTGSVWIVCPEAGACKVQCACTQERTRSAGSILIDLAVAVTVVSGCGLLFFAL